MQSLTDTEAAHRENPPGRPRTRNTARPTAIIEPQKILELGNGLELWKVHPSLLREQDVNARSMPKAMFERLSQTIARDKRLESLPFCAKTERSLEIVSGHHRVRAGTAAGISEMFVLVDVTGLTRSQIAAKQLAHNAIEGQDNEQLLAEIYKEIQDAESKLEAFIDAKLDVEVPRVKIEGLDIEIDFKTVLLIFLPRVKERLDRALEYIRSSGHRLDGVYIAADSDYGPLEKAVRKINQEWDVRVVADAIGKMADLALQASGVSVEDPERVHLKDLLGSAWVPREAAAVIRQALQKMLKAGNVGQTNRWQALEYWAAEYLSGAPTETEGGK
jgi:ParB-like chromosome segregation protein Spo0J